MLQLVTTYQLDYNLPRSQQMPPMTRGHQSLLKMRLVTALLLLVLSTQGQPLVAPATWASIRSDESQPILNNTDDAGNGGTTGGSSSSAFQAYSSESNSSSSSSSSDAGHGDAAAAQTTAASFLWLSDLHLDPMYGTPDAYGRPELCAGGPNTPIVGRPGCDSPLVLVKAAFAAAKSTAETSAGGTPSFVLMSGDFARHNITTSLCRSSGNTITDTVLQILDTAAIEASLAFNTRADASRPSPHDEDRSSIIGENISLIPVLGNNDLAPANHLEITTELPFTDEAALVPNSYLTSVAAVWWRHGLLETATEASSFSHGGYYSRDTSVPGLRVLVLNSIAYSLSLEPTTNMSDPFGQFAWLRGQLEEAREDQGRVYLVGHIPPSLQSFRPGEPNWAPGFLGVYSDLSREFSDVIAAHLYGHTHSGELRSLASLSRPPPPHPHRAPMLFSQNSVVPTGKGGVDFSHPAFSLCTIDAATGRIVDQAVFAAALDDTGADPVTFRGMIPSLTSLLGISALSNEEVERMSRLAMADEELWHNYWDVFYKGGVPQARCNGACRAQQTCLLRHPLDQAAFQRCTDEGDPGDDLIIDDALLTHTDNRGHGIADS